MLWLGEERLAAVDLLAAEDAEPFTLAQRLLRLAEGWLSWRGLERLEKLLTFCEGSCILRKIE